MACPSRELDIEKSPLACEISARGCVETPGCAQPPATTASAASKSRLRSGRVMPVDGFIDRSRRELRIRVFLSLRTCCRTTSEENGMTGKQRISYVPLDEMTPEMRAEMERCAREGTPRPESSAVRAHVPAAFWFFANAGTTFPQRRRRTRAQGALPGLRLPLVKCEYCGNQRSEQGTLAGTHRGQIRRTPQLRVARTSTTRGRRRRWLTPRRSPGTFDTDDAFWDRLYQHFTEAELVELGCFVGLTLGQQSWLRLLNIDHHQVMPGTKPPWLPASRTPTRWRRRRLPRATGRAHLTACRRPESA